MELTNIQYQSMVEYIIANRVISKQHTKFILNDTNSQSMEQIMRSPIMKGSILNVISVIIKPQEKTISSNILNQNTMELGINVNIVITGSNLRSHLHSTKRRSMNNKITQAV